MESKRGSTRSFTIDNLLREEEGKKEESKIEKKQQKRRQRSSFSAVQVHFLEIEFRNQRYISPESRARLASALGLTQQQIKIWFQNRRYKSKPKSPNGTLTEFENASGPPQIVENGVLRMPQWIGNPHWFNMYYYNLCSQNPYRFKSQ
ncbi:hypothetical protein L596_004079 [Steinernema carpocapsae]|uniref:Homeobox domain-containing protein n=1 Tax=Steinernema carpocapsae TaxID=34508 RepID=A0A4V6I882_STECR|nr:hypothetical protein L596_004079 [Steinernema carpocapsae]